MASYDEFANWLLAQLQQLGWSQEELARRAHITSAQVSRIISGERKAGPSTCRAIARALHLPPEEVFRQAGLLPRTHEPVLGADELLFYYSQYSDEDRRRLLVIARSLYQLSDKG